jgi:hypothetical protein
VKAWRRSGLLITTHRPGYAVRWADKPLYASWPRQ